MRLLTIFLTVLVVAASVGIAFRSSQYAKNAKSILEQERYLRIVAEENLENANTKVTSLEGELAKAQKKISGIEKMLEEMKAYNEDLKTRLDKAAELKAVMEAKIKELEKISSPL